MTEMTANGWEQHVEACRKRLAQGDSAGAESAFASALAEAEAAGPDSPALAACLTVLAQVRLQQRDHPSAEQLFRRALEVRERAAEFDHTGVIQVLGHLATLHSARADYDEAESLLLRALTLADKFLQSSHPAVASLLNNLSRLYFKRADYAKADRMLVRLLQIKQALGTEHPEVAGVLASIAALRSALGKHDVAEQLWRRVLAIREKSLPNNDPALVTTLNSLADACASQGEHEEALHFRERGLRLQANVPGSGQADAPSTISAAIPDNAGTPARSHAPVPEPPAPAAPATVARPTPPPVEIAPLMPPAATSAPTPIPVAEVTPSVQHSRITPIPLAPLVPPAKPPLEPFDPRVSGDFAPLPTAAGGKKDLGIGGPVATPAAVPGIGAPRATPGQVPAGIGRGSSTPAHGAAGIGGPPSGLIGSLDGIASPPPVPGKPTTAVPAGVPQAFAGFEPPPATRGPILAAPLAPTAPAPAPRERAPAPPQRERARVPTAAPERRSEPSLERPRYQGYEETDPPASRRGGIGKVLAGLAVAAGIGFAAFTLVGGDDLSPVEAVADTVVPEPRMIRIPAESLKVSRGPDRQAAPATTISLDSALAASRARNALDTGSTLGVTADSAARPIVVPGPRTLDALSRAVDAGLKPSLDSAFRAPAPATPGFRAP